MVMAEMTKKERSPNPLWMWSPQLGSEWLGVQGMRGVSENVLRFGVWMARRLEHWKSGEADTGSVVGVWDLNVTNLRCRQDVQVVMFKML